jgi:hypothetical protein
MLDVYAVTERQGRGSDLFRATLWTQRDSRPAHQKQVPVHRRHQPPFRSTFGNAFQREIYERLYFETFAGGRIENSSHGFLGAPL